MEGDALPFPVFGQVVIGPPGSGKSTYCNGMQQFMTAIGRKCIVVNLDPANDQIPYECAVDVQDLIELTEVMEETALGPNGAMMYCLEYLEVNLDWLESKLEGHRASYVMFDCPGQVELFTHHHSLSTILHRLTHSRGMRLTCVNLVDAHYCSNTSTYVALLLMSLSAMLRLELPHLNVLSKVDLVEQYGELDFNLDFYSEAQNLSVMFRRMGKDARNTRFHAMNEAVSEMVEDFGLLHFHPLNINDKESVRSLLAHVDKSNGYVYVPAEASAQTPDAAASSTVDPRTLFVARASEPWAEALEAQAKYVDVNKVNASDATSSGEGDPGGEDDKDVLKGWDLG